MTTTPKTHSHIVGANSCRHGSSSNPICVDDFSENESELRFNVGEDHNESSERTSRSIPVCVDDFLEEEFEHYNNDGEDHIVSSDRTSRSNPVCIDDFLEEELERSGYCGTERGSSLSGASENNPTSVDEVSEIEGSERSDYIGIECDTSVAKNSIGTESGTLSTLTEHLDTEEVTSYMNNEVSINYYINHEHPEDDDILSHAPEPEYNRLPKRKVSFLEPDVEAHELTYEEYKASSGTTKLKSIENEREERRESRFEQSEGRRISKLMWCAVALLLLEVSAATIFVKNYQELIECCGTSVFSGNESTAERWDTIFYWIGVSYLIVLILVEIPTLVIAKEPLFLFNPMIGFLLAMQMMYATDTKNAFIVYCLETAAMLGQSVVLIQMHRSPESCIHSTLNYTLCGITIYLYIRLTQQGGYCIIDNRIQSVFSDSTCNVACIDDATCFRCTSGEEGFVPQCFIRFLES